MLSATPKSPVLLGHSRTRRGSAMTGASTVDVYYDPFDFEIDDDPHPVWKRLRDEAPLYYNEKYDFFAQPVCRCRSGAE